MKFSKRSSGDQSNYVSNIVAGEEPSLPVLAPQPTRIAHVPKSTAATLAQPVKPKTVAAAQIKNIRRKSSISDRLMHSNTSDANLVDNIMKEMDRAAAATSAENARSPSATKQLKVLTPGQLNSNCTTENQQIQAQHQVDQNQKQTSNEHAVQQEIQWVENQENNTHQQSWSQNSQINQEQPREQQSQQQQVISSHQPSASADSVVFGTIFNCVGQTSHEVGFQYGLGLHSSNTNNIPG
jgi:DNA polymerase III alpha subunit (gram-positive type)